MRGGAKHLISAQSIEDSMFYRTLFFMVFRLGSGQKLACALANHTAHVLNIPQTSKQRVYTGRFYLVVHLLPEYYSVCTTKNGVAKMTIPKQPRKRSVGFFICSGPRFQILCMVITTCFFPLK